MPTGTDDAEDIDIDGFLEYDFSAAQLLLEPTILPSEGATASVLYAVRHNQCAYSFHLATHQ